MKKRSLVSLLAVAVALFAISLTMGDASTASAAEPKCPGGSNPDPNVIMCQDWENTTTDPMTGWNSWFDDMSVGYGPICGSGVTQKCMRVTSTHPHNGTKSLEFFFPYDIQPVNPWADKSLPVATTELYHRFYVYFSYTPSGSCPDRAAVDACTALKYPSPPYNNAIDHCVCAFCPSTDFCWDEQGATKMFGWHTLPSNDVYYGQEIFDQYRDVTVIAQNVNANFGQNISTVPFLGGQWYCVEQHVKLNTAGQSDGVIELWIDDVLRGQHIGLNFNTGSQQRFYSVADGVALMYIQSYRLRPIDQYWWVDDEMYSRARIGCGLTPSPSPTPPPPPSSTKFNINDRVQVINGILNVRSTPSTSGTLLGSQPIGVLGTVVGGPTAANGFNWWNINFDSGADGWSVEDNLTKITADTTPPPAPGTPSITLQSTGATAATFSITWTASTDNVGVAGYAYSAGYNDGTGSQSGSVSTNSMTLNMPYHSSGTAQTGYFCVKAKDAAGNLSTDQACNALSVPAKPAGTLAGDLNADSSINALDLQLEVNVILGINTDPTIRSRADLNGDTAVNALDLQMLVNKVLGL